MKPNFRMNHPFPSRYWIQYHNKDKIGFPAKSILDDELKLPLTESTHYISTNKHWIKQTKGDTVFLILGLTVNGKKEYYLWTKTLIRKIEEINLDGDFQYNASGEQFYLFPPQLLNKKPGFEEFFNKTGHFSIGFQNITDWKFTETLRNLSEQFKYEEETNLSFQQYINKFLKMLKERKK